MRGEHCMCIFTWASAYSPRISSRVFELFLSIQFHDALTPHANASDPANVCTRVPQGMYKGVGLVAVLFRRNNVKRLLSRLVDSLLHLSVMALDTFIFQVSAVQSPHEQVRVMGRDAKRCEEIRSERGRD